jgi:phosphoenolpyruvate---glycerone phosphotransferase subunit DhaM
MTGPVGIVLVSHSAELASGLRVLVRQIGTDEVPVAVAGGTEDGRIGTSYALVMAAIADADRGAGVVILADLGSAVLTARQALTDQPRPDVIIVDAPFVEGAVAAAATASGGADLATVVRIAEEARDFHKL